MHQNVGDAIEQIEMKLGTGASTPAANKALVSNGTASEWGQITGPMIANNAVGNDQLIASPTFTGVTTATVTASGAITADSLSLVAACSVGETVSSSAGSASTPSYNFTGDTNTGMYRSAADELSLRLAVTKH